VTAKFCCSKFPLRSSIRTTETFGRLKWGAKTEQAASVSATASAIASVVAMAAAATLATAGRCGVNILCFSVAT
jgi:hypothetical protein